MDKPGNYRFRVKAISKDVNSIQNSPWSEWSDLYYWDGSELEEYEPNPNPSTPTVGGFTDVKASDYFADAVVWAVENGITSGVGNNKFGPNQKCTRGQIVTFLWNAAGKPEPESTVNPFTDIKPSDYYYKAVLWAVENDITSGMTATTFGPSTVCTRAQAMTFIWNSKGKPTWSGAENPFTDVSKDAYYYDSVMWAKENGVTSGLSATKFGSNSPCTRGQIVTFLYNAR